MAPLRALFQEVVFPQAARPNGLLAYGYDCFALRALPLSRRCAVLQTAVGSGLIPPTEVGGYTTITFQAGYGIQTDMLCFMAIG